MADTKKLGNYKIYNFTNDIDIYDEVSGHRVAHIFKSGNKKMDQERLATALQELTN